MKKLLLLLCLPLSIFAQNIRINQIGYETKGPKMAVIEHDAAINYTSFDIVTESGQTVYSGSVQAQETVTGWQGRYFQLVEFSDLQDNGVFKVRVDNMESNTFEIGDNLFFDKVAYSVIDFFYNMRHTETNDETISFNGTRSDIVDLSGGWFDATGDPGKHMSHLSYANHFSPQQIPMVAWSLMEAYELDEAGFQGKMSDLQSEIAWGIDYLMRNHDDAGYFYLAIFDDWGGAPGSREVCEWGVEGNNAGRTPNYQCALREGGGMAIAALAKAHRLGFTGGGFTSNEILQLAEESFAHLRAADPTHGTVNEAYCNDHTENIIDDYCGLMASVELYKATNNANYLATATEYYNRLIAKQQAEGWFASDVAGNRPFYHAADEGLPIVSLIKYMEIEPSATTTIEAALTDWIAWYKTITQEVANPFNYVRQYHKPYQDGSLGTAKKAFFLPHNNETGYWWQGENARLSSMTTAFLQASKVLDDNFSLENNENGTLAISQLDWIMGRNPFNLCMITGFGHQNYPVYKNGDTYSTNHVGGICNGITAMDSDENDIDWAPYDDGAPDGWQNWRWVEQWLPHDAWFLLAVSSLSKTIKASGGITPKPEVTVTNPASNAYLNNGDPITITADVTDTTALISTVEFFVNGSSLGFDSDAPYSMAWTPSVGGNNTIKVVAYNSNGVTANASITVIVDGQGPYKELITLPGNFEAEDYDTGGEGIAYHDTDAGNQTGAYRDDDVDIESASEGGFNISYIETDEYLEYTVNIAATGIYDFEYRIAAGLDGGELHAELDGTELANSTINVISTGGWQNWQTFTASDVTLQEGIHVLRIYFDAGPLNLNSITVVSKVEDCAGVIGGSAYLDNCNTCVGGDTGLDACTVDCNGDWGGTAEVDECDICAGGNTGIVAGESCTPEEDCAGVPGGEAYNDECGNCVGGTTGLTTIDTDDDGQPDCIDADDDNDNVDDVDDCAPLNPTIGAANTWYLDADADGLGSAVATPIVDCDQPTGYVDNSSDNNDNDFDNDGVEIGDDCNDADENIGGQLTWYEDADNDGLGDSESSTTACTQPPGYVANAQDQCPQDGNKTIPGECGCGETEESCKDCAGVPNGTAFLDNCNDCVGGTTDQTACEQDCNDEWGGTATEDVCGTCSGGSTGLVPITDPQQCIATPLAEELSFETPQVSPNPFEKTVLVELTGSFSLTVYDIAGVLVYEGDHEHYAQFGSGLTAGIYFIRITSNKVDEIIKVVKQ